MRTETFFKYLGRFNQLLFAAFAFAMAVVLGREALWYLRHSEFTPSHEISLARDEAAPEQAKITLERWGVAARGTSIAIYAARSFDLHSSYSSKKDGSTIRNLYFFNALSGEGRWLFRENKQIVCSDRAFPNAANSATSPAPVRMMVFLVARSDTDGNGRVDCRDKKTLGAVRSDGADYAEFYDGIENGELNAWDGGHETERPYIDLLIRKEGAWRILVIDPDRSAVTRDHRIEGQAVP